SIHDPYNVGAFEKDALQTLESLFKTKDIVIMVGGSGLYIDAVTKGLDDFPDIKSSIRSQLNDDLQTKGLAFLQDQLKSLDPQSYKTMAIENPHRVIRALEICIGTSKPYSSFLNHIKTKRTFKTINIGLDADRTLIYHRINQRVDMMLQAGLLDEARNLYQYRLLNALNTVGYKELFNYFEGNWTLNFAVSEIKKNTRRFAKRQLTWFKKDKSIQWFDYLTPVNQIISEINKKIT
ncbi:MAG: tRNA (adenosine(37)-N6)-dimethylallyltransferase MiaA, partial [Flavobacteriales bacterium]|nr:tRNA (adenosine(37)-N6)-dimethylallyltransferase MiaA [Flavobacteriales bacterium]